MNKNDKNYNTIASLLEPILGIIILIIFFFTILNSDFGQEFSFVLYIAIGLNILIFIIQLCKIIFQKKIGQIK